MFQENSFKVSSLSFCLGQVQILTAEECRYLGKTMFMNNYDVCQCKLIIEKEFSKCSVDVKYSSLF